MARLGSEKLRVGVDEIVAHFHALEDPRSAINRRHPLVSVVVIAIMAVLAGASGPTSVADWARMKEEFLLELLPLPNGIPRKDVFRRVLMMLDPATFQACFTEWLASLWDKAAAAAMATGAGVERPTLNVDGKTLRRSHDRGSGLGPLHSVSIWASEFGLTLGQVATDGKSNEITAIPELLRLVDLRGAVVTIDAMGTQTAIAEQVVDAEADYVLALKGNQGTLYQAAVDYVDEQVKVDFAGAKARRLTTTEAGHGREETRTYVQMPVPPGLAGAGRWAGLATLGVAMLCRRVRDGVETSDVRYFISSLGMGVKQFAHAVRSHWSIENGCHWCLDVTYREDESRIREAHLRENFAWLNRLTLSLLKRQQNKKSVATNRRCCGWNDDVLLKVLTGKRT